MKRLNALRLPLSSYRSRSGLRNQSAEVFLRARHSLDGGMAVREGFQIDSPRSQNEQVRKEDGGVALKALDKRAIGIEGRIAGTGNIHGDGVAIAQVGERDHKRAINQLTDGSE